MKTLAHHVYTVYWNVEKHYMPVPDRRLGL